MYAFTSVVGGDRSQLPLLAADTLVLVALSNLNINLFLDKFIR